MGHHCFCVEDNLLGFCVSEEDKNEFTREVTRSESAIDTDIDAPIRIHKYNIDESELRSLYEEDGEDESAKKARIAEALRSVLEEREKKLASDYAESEDNRENDDDDSEENSSSSNENQDGQIFMNPSALEALLNLESGNCPIKHFIQKIYHIDSSSSSSPLTQISSGTR